MGASETRGPDPVEIGSGDHATACLWQRVAAGDRGVILRHHDGDRWVEVTWNELGEQVEDLAAGLVASGVRPGDRVALMGPTRLEWSLVDLAVLSAGAVTVPIYETSSPDQCRWVLDHAGVRMAFAATSDEAEVLDKAATDRERAAGAFEVLTFEERGLDELRARAGTSDRDEVARRRDALGPDDVATIVYTSGTTGRPKGCVITHRNVVWTARQVQARLGEVIGPDDSTVLFLPLAHIFSRVIQFVCLEVGVSMSYARSLDLLAEDLRECRPTFLLAVPRVFEKTFRAARRQATGAKGLLFELSVRVARRWSRAGRPGPLLGSQRALFDRLVYAKLRDAVGGHVRYAVSGGAALDPDLAHFFRGAGITILEGYGLTETTAPATVNAPDELRIGTVGRPLPGVELRIADDSEILVRGGSVFQGYLGDDEETAAAFDDGWLLTGDVGSLDGDGYLTITDRKKDLIVTASGKNVAPTPLEDRIRSHRLVANAMLVGDGRPFVGALITLDPDALEDLVGSRDTEAAHDDRVRREVQQAVDDANRLVSRAESVREFVVVTRDFSEDEGELTPTMKLRRGSIADHFADDVARIYGS